MARRKTARPGGSNGSCRDGDGLLDVVVVILEGGYTSTAVAPIEIFHSAGVVWNWLHGEATKPRFRVRTASVDGRSVKSVCALGLTPDCALSVIKKADIIIVPASGWDAIDLIAKNTPLLPWLKKWHDRGAYIAGVCTGIAFLAECGMLDGKRTGASPIFWASATPRFVGNPSSLSRKTAVFSAVAGSTPRSTSVSIWSKNSAVTKSHFSAPNRSCSACHAGRQSGYSVVQLSRPHSDEKIRQSEEYLQQHFDRDISIDILARQAGMGPRNFIRRFKAATGRVPGAYLQTLRVSAAKEML